MPHNTQYGRDSNGDPIVAPPGWELLPFGAIIPDVHREYLDHPMGKRGWSDVMNGKNIRAPYAAAPYGFIFAFAVPTKDNKDAIV